MLRWSYMQLSPLLQTNCRWGTLLVFVKIVSDIFQAWNSMRCLENGWFGAKEESLNTMKYWNSCLDTRKRDRYCSWHKLTCGSRCDRKVHIGKVFEIDDSDAKISFYEYTGTLSIRSTFCEPKKRDEIWVDFVNILYVVPVPAETKRGKKFEKFVLDNVMEKFPVWKNKNWRFFLVLYCIRYSRWFFLFVKRLPAQKLKHTSYNRIYIVLCLNSSYSL